MRPRRRSPHPPTALAACILPPSAGRPPRQTLPGLRPGRRGGGWGSSTARPGGPPARKVGGSGVDHGTPCPIDSDCAAADGTPCPAHFGFFGSTRELLGKFGCAPTPKRTWCPVHGIQSAIGGTPYPVHGAGVALRSETDRPVWTGGGACERGGFARRPPSARTGCRPWTPSALSSWRLELRETKKKTRLPHGATRRPSHPPLRARSTSPLCRRRWRRPPRSCSRGRRAARGRRPLRHEWVRAVGRGSLDTVVAAPSVPMRTSRTTRRGAPPVHASERPPGSRR
jgi:hypothetical protein